jgi:hypothetical protein
MKNFSQSHQDVFALKYSKNKTYRNILMKKKLTLKELRYKSVKKIYHENVFVY